MSYRYFEMAAIESEIYLTLIRYFLIKKSRDLVSHNSGILGLKNGQDTGIANPTPKLTPKCCIILH